MQKQTSNSQPFGWVLCALVSLPQTNHTVGCESLTANDHMPVSDVNLLLHYKHNSLQIEAYTVYHSTIGYTHAQQQQKHTQDELGCL